MKEFLKISVSLLTAFILILSLATPASACTGVIVGSDLTADGSTIFGRTEDLETNHNKVYKVHEAGEHKKGDKLIDVAVTEEGGYEFVLPHDSYKFTSVSDTTPEYGIFDEAGYNEKGLIADMTVSANSNDAIQEVDPYVEGDEGKNAGISEGIITTVVLSTADNAQDAVKLVANEVAVNGSAEGNAFVVADTNELWYVEIYSGHQFVAMKYPSDKFSVFPNAFWLNEVKLTVGEESDNYITSEDGNFIYSKGIFEVAKNAKTFDGNEEERTINLLNSYGEKEVSDSNRSRACSGILCLNPNAKLTMESEVYEFLQSAPEKSITVKNVMNFTRNRLENINIQANDLGRGNEYPIGNRNTMEAHVFQIPQDSEEQAPGIMWLTLGSPLVQPFVPYYPNQTDGIAQVKNETNEPDAANSHYWLAMDILHMVEVNRPEFMEVVKPLIDAAEDEMIAKSISKSTSSAETDPNSQNAEDANNTFKLLTDIHSKLKEKYDEYLKNNDYTFTFFGRRKTANFTGIKMDVPAGTSTSYMRILVSPDESGNSGSFDIVDAYGNPISIDKLPNAVKFTVPMSVFETKPNFATLNSALDVKEENGNYVFSTDETTVRYSTVSTSESSSESLTSESASDVASESSSAEAASSNGKLPAPVLVIGAVVIVAVVVTFMRDKNKKNK